MEVSVYKYPARCNKSADITNLHNNRIRTLGFPHNWSNYALDCWELPVPLTVTIPARAEAIATFKTWDDQAV